MILMVKVIPNSSNNIIVGWVGERLKIKVTMQAEKGRANAAVIKLLRDFLGINNDRITLLSGHTNSYKKFHLKQISASNFTKLIAAHFDAQANKNPGDAE